MDNAVGLVQAYLRLNGYFTVTEHPVIAMGRDGRYRTATDLDVLAFRFPRAGRLVPGRGRSGDEEHMVVDKALNVQADQPDMLVGEVKEGRAVLNDAASDPGVLRTVLVTFGCCPRADVPRIAKSLLRDGHAVLPDGHHIRTAVFASVTADADTSRHLVISLGHVVKFLRSYIEEHWEVMRQAESKDPAFGFLMMLAKAERGDG
ncbi:MAG: hypothetical protein WEE89_13220 [Gemmatimonadota bacterium]